MKALVLGLLCIAAATMGCGADDPTTGNADSLNTIGGCVDKQGRSDQGIFARACGGWGEMCEVCGESAVCNNETRTCDSTCTGLVGIGCYVDKDCPLNTCIKATCEKSSTDSALGECVYAPRVVESGGCIVLRGGVESAGMCDDCDCVPTPAD